MSSYIFFVSVAAAVVVLVLVISNSWIDVAPLHSEAVRHDVVRMVINVASQAMGVLVVLAAEKKAVVVSVLGIDADLSLYYYSLDPAVPEYRVAIRAAVVAMVDIVPMDDDLWEVRMEVAVVDVEVVVALVVADVDLAVYVCWKVVVTAVDVLVLLLHRY